MRIYFLTLWRMKILFLTFLISLLFISCSSEYKEEPMNSYSISSNQEKPYINLDNNIRESILNYISKLNIGDNWKDIKQEYKAYFIEESIAGKKDNIARGIIRTIYLRKLDKELVNEKYDEYVYLIYDLNNNLIKKNIVKGRK